MALTKSSTAVAEALVNLFKDNFVAAGLNSPDDVYYGDEVKIPRYPSIAVQPSVQTRKFTSTGMKVDIDFTTFILVYHSSLSSPSELKREADERTEAIIDLLDQNRNLGGIVINGLVSSSEPGAVDTGGSLVRASRLTHSALSKVHI